MSVNLEVGMTAIRRDGERGGVVESGDTKFPFKVGWNIYPAAGTWLRETSPPNSIIAAGYPWAELGAQVGDTVRCVWNGLKVCNHERLVYEQTPDVNEESLFVIVKRAAKPDILGYIAYDHSAPPDVYFCAGCSQRAYRKWKKGDAVDRPRAAHKLGLRDGDVVELTGWQNASTFRIGELHTVEGLSLVGRDGVKWHFVKSIKPKGHRPLFRVVSRAEGDDLSDMPEFRAAEHKPDEWATVSPIYFSDQCRGYHLKVTFPAGSDTGTVIREAL